MHAIKRNKNLGRTVGVWESRVPDEKGTINWKTVNNGHRGWSSPVGWVSVRDLSLLPVKLCNLHTTS